MTITDPSTHDVAHAAAVRVEHITQRAGDTTTLRDTSFSLQAGEVVGIAGASGAGKTTLLETIAGVRRPFSGTVTRADVAAFVPQDDIIHRELPLRRNLLHAAALRIPDADAQMRAQIVDRVLRRLDLDEQVDVIVDDLSGGQRKRASLAAEMLTDPRLFFLDEPTSGLDPANAAEVIGALRSLAATGSTVVFATHAPADLARCDRVVFVARGGEVAFIGTPGEALDFFGVSDLAEIYQHLNDWPFNTAPDNAPAVSTGVHAETVDLTSESTGPDTRPPSLMRQWSTLVRRNVDLIAGNRLTLAILAGSPVFIIATMTFLFPTGVFDAGTGDLGLAIQTLFWMAFNSFFFGITYGLLQVVGELEIVRRERRIGLSMSAYVASKLTVLLPLLAAVNAAQLVAMEMAGRLPDLAAADRAAMFMTLQLLSTAAVVIGLHASSAVRNAAQAALALPMLCFPQVLFAGAVVPVSKMGWFAEAMSMPLAARWGFEPLGRILDLGPQAAQQPATSGYGEAFTGSPVEGWAVLAGLIAIGVVGTVRSLIKRTTPA